MASEKNSSIAARLLVSILLIAVIIWFVGVENILAVLSEFDPSYIPLLFALTAILVLFNALAIYVLIIPIKKIGFLNFFKNYLYSWTLGFLFPGKLGDFSLGFFLRKDISIGKVSAIVVIDKIISLAFFVLLGFALFTRLGLIDSIQNLAVFSLSGLLVLVFLFSKQGRNFLKRVLGKKSELFEGFFNTLKEFAGKRKRFLAVNLFITIIRAGLKGFVTVLVLESIGYSMGLVDAVLVNSTVVIVSLAPITISGLGLKEGAFIFFASLIGVDLKGAAGSVVIANFINYTFVLVIFYFAVMKRLPELKSSMKVEKVKRSAEKEKLLLSCGAIKEKGEFLPTKLEVKEKKKGKLVGIAGISVRYAILPSLFLAVDQKHRKKGIGLKLVKEVLKRKKGILFLTVAYSNKPALKIYSKCGFKKIGPWRKIQDKPHMLMIKL